MINKKKVRGFLLVSTVLIGVVFVAAGCKKEEPLKVGEVVYSQWSEGEHHGWEEAKVIAIEGEEVSIKWKNTFAKGSDTMPSKHISKVIKRKPLDAKKAKVSMKVLIHPPAYLYLYKGEIVKIEDDRYTVKYSPGGTVENEEEVGIEALWWYK